MCSERRAPGGKWGQAHMCGISFRKLLCLTCELCLHVAGEQHGVMTCQTGWALWVAPTPLLGVVQDLGCPWAVANGSRPGRSVDIRAWRAPQSFLCAPPWGIQEISPKGKLQAPVFPWSDTQLCDFPKCQWLWRQEDRDIKMRNSIKKERQ